MLNYQSATEIMSQVLTKSTGCFKTALTEKIRHYPGIQYVYNISDVMRVRIYIYVYIYIGIHYPLWKGLRWVTFGDLHV